MADLNGIDQLNAAIKAVNGILSVAQELLKNAVSTPQNDSEESRIRHFKTLKTLLQQLQDRKMDLDTSAKLIANPHISIRESIGYTATLAQDPKFDKTTKTEDQILGYRYLSNCQEYSALALQAITSKFLKRNIFLKQRLLRTKTHSGYLNNHLIPVHTVETLILSIERMYNIRPMEVSKPFGAFILVKFTLDRAMRVVLVLRGITIQWVLIKGIDESFEDPTMIQLNKYEKRFIHGNQHLDSKFDLWTSSKYEIFRMITEHANAAILHFYHPLQMEGAIKAYIAWIKSYSSPETSLFQIQCKKCDARLLNGMPPTWRDFRTYEPYHFDCRP